MRAENALAFVVLACAAVLYIPPGEFVLGGWDPGVYLNSGVSLARESGFSAPDPLLAAAGPAAQEAVVSHGYLQPGFYWDAASGSTVTQFPLMLTVWMAAAVRLGGPEAGLYVPTLVGVLAVGAFYLFTRRLAGSPVAVCAAALLAFNGLQLWHARLSLSEGLVQLFLFAGLWSALRWRDKGGCGWAIAAGICIGLLPLVKTEAAVLGVLGGAAQLWGNPPHGRLFWGAYLACLSAAAIHYLTVAWPVVSAQMVGAWAMVMPEAVREAPGSASVGSFGEALWAGLYLGVPDGLLLVLAPVALLVAWHVRRRLGVGGARDKPLGVGTLWPGAVIKVWAQPPSAVRRALARPRPRAGEGACPTWSHMVEAAWIACRPLPWDRAPRLALLVLAGGVALYLAVFLHYYNAREVIPLFLWGARRLVPVVLPVVLLVEAWCLCALVAGCVPARYRVAATTAALVLVLAARMPDIELLRQHREYEGALGAAAQIASALDANAVVLVEADDTGIRFAAPLRFIHQRSTYLLRKGASSLGIEALVSAARSAGRPVYYLGGALSLTLSHKGRGEQDLELVQRWRFELPELERTSVGRPRAWRTYTATPALYRTGNHG